MAFTTYFAYGSNMLTARLRARCPSAIPIGVAKAEAYEFCYGKRGQDGSAKATLIHREGAQAYGVLFRLSDADMAVLDDFEGRGRGYDRHDSFVVSALSNGAPITTSTYLAPASFVDKSILPFDWYTALVLAGATEHGLPGHYVAGTIGALPETTIDRQTQRSAEALQILEKTNFYHFLKGL